MKLTEPRLLPLAALLLSLLAGACASPENGFTAFKSLDDAEWLYTDTVSFTPGNVADSLSHGKLELALRHTRGYRWANVWLELSYPSVAPGDSGVYLRDTLNLILADAFGRWQGAGSGASYMHKITVDSNFTLVKNHPLRLRHIMRVDTLDQIEQIGIIFTPTE